MHAQLIHFDGPRSPELVAASERAGRERLTPALLADPRVASEHVCIYVLRRPDGGETLVMITDDEQTLDRVGDIAMSTELLPGEDLALLPGPDRVERLAVVHAVEHGRVVLS